MAKEETITEVLIEEHGKMREMLARFIRAIERDTEEMKEVYALFRNKEKRHVFIEENKIFNTEFAPRLPVIKTLILQHIEMAKMLTNIGKNMEEKKDSTEIALLLQDYLRNHTHLEEKKFYPLLDEKIPAEKKQKFISMITEEFNR
jgi:hemerythrin-like domain-containing protein